MNKITDPLDLRKRIEPSEQTLAMPLDYRWLEWQREAAAPLRKYSRQQRLDRLEDKLRAAIAMEVNENLLSGRFLEYLQTLAIAVQNCRRSIIVRTLPRHCWRQSWRYQCQKRML